MRSYHFRPGFGWVTKGKVIIVSHDSIDQLPPFDPRCKKEPKDLPEYWSFAQEEYEWDLMEGEPTAVSWKNLGDEARISQVNHYVRNNEGTYNPENGHFLCTECYVAIGMPSSPSGWKCP